MKVSIILTTDDGNTFQGEMKLSATTAPRASRTKHRAAIKTQNTTTAVNLASPLRPFMKRNTGGMGGPQKFALLIAHLASGDTKKEITLALVQKHWRKMTGFLGKWNPAYTTRAKEQEWVDSPKFGAYVLMPGWKGLFNA